MQERAPSKAFLQLWTCPRTRENDRIHFPRRDSWFRAVERLRALGFPNYPAAPVACMIIFGLVHASFEDWVFAVGSYVTLVFWLLAMSLPDLVGDSAVQTLGYEG